MSALTTMWIVLIKELRDIGRDRRTLYLTLLIGPLLFPAIILGMGSLAEKRAVVGAARGTPGVTAVHDHLVIDLTQA